MSSSRRSRILSHRRTVAEALALIDSTDEYEVKHQTETVKVRVEVENKVEPPKPKPPQPITEPVQNPPQKAERLGEVWFRVLWAKPSGRKKRTWEGDGRLCISASGSTLFDEDDKRLSAGPAPKPDSPEEGAIFSVGSKEVEIVERCAVPDNAAALLADGKRQHCFDSRKTDAKKHKPNPRPHHSLNIPIVSTQNYRAPSEAVDALVLPPPPNEHQWEFNATKRPVNAVVVDAFLCAKLRPHQREGLVFLYECVMGYKRPEYAGAILADEMGLGKTLQCIALIWTLLKHGPYGVTSIKKALVVAPSTLCITWQREFLKWLGRERLVPFLVDSANKPKDFVAQRISPVMIVSYERLAKSVDEIANMQFDLIVCDEAHRLKNAHIKTAQAFERLACKRRVLLTGTPFQNDLQEYFVLVDVANPGVLGTYAEFRRQFQDPILRSRAPDCTEEEREIGTERSNRLKFVTSTFILRRTQSVLERLLPAKTEYVVCCRLNEYQQELYSSVLDKWWCESQTMSGVSPLSLIVTLKKICNHPSLLKMRESSLNDENEAESIRLNVDINDKESSGKLDVLRELLQCIVLEKREKAVIVSCSTQMLDVLGVECSALKIQHLRLDGNTSLQQRQRVVDTFNSNHQKLECDSSIPGVLLLSSRAGGVGLSLPGASRLILYDSDWNPAVDVQAMARIWREGQKRPVHIYRFLSTGTIEEKIYQRQIYKQGLSEAVLLSNSKSNTKLSEDELKDLFSMGFDVESTTHETIKCRCREIDMASILECDKSDEDESYDKINGPGEKSSNVNDLKNWEHFGEPIDADFLKEMGMANVSDKVSFVFRKIFRAD